MYQMLPNQRARNITGIVYAEDAMKAVGRYELSPHGEKWYSDLVSYMAALHVPCAVSPVHNDVYDLDGVKQWMERHVDPKTGKLKDEFIGKCPNIGDVKPLHAHILFKFPGAKTRKQMSEYMFDYCPIRETMWQEVKNVDSMIRYFCHLDSIDPTQRKYDIRSLYAFGGLDVSCLEENKEVTRTVQLMDITQLILKEKMKHYSQLVRYALNSGDVEMFGTVAGRAPYFASFFKGMSDERAEKKARDEMQKKLAGKQ